MLEYIVVTAMPLDPAISLEARHDFGAAGLWLGHPSRFMRKYWRIQVSSRLVPSRGAD
jgi:hypothetical protein